MSDIYLFNTTDGGNISVNGGLVTQTDGPETYVYLALFGGNYDDPGLSDRKKEWWGNIGEGEEASYRSRTQFLLKTLPLNSGTLRRIEEAVRQDLKDVKFSSVEASIPRINTLQLVVDDITLTITGG